MINCFVCIRYNCKVLCDQIICFLNQRYPVVSTLGLSSPHGNSALTKMLQQTDVEVLCLVLAGYLIELAKLQSSLWPNHLLFKSKVSYGKLMEKVRYCVREVI